MTQHWMEHQRTLVKLDVCLAHVYKAFFFFFCRRQDMTFTSKWRTKWKCCVGRVWESSYLHRSSRHMSGRSSHGIHNVVHKTFQVLWPGICKSRTHTHLSHYRSNHRGSDSASVMIQGRSYTLHPPACKTQDCSFTPWPLPSTSNLYSSPVDEHMPDGGWVGGRLQSSLSPVMTTHLGFWRKNFVWFLRMDQIMAEFVSVSYCMLASWYLKKKKTL